MQKQLDKIPSDLKKLNLPANIEISEQCFPEEGTVILVEALFERVAADLVSTLEPKKTRQQNRVAASPITGPAVNSDMGMLSREKNCHLPAESHLRAMPRTIASSEAELEAFTMESDVYHFHQGLGDAVGSSGFSALISTMFL